MAVKNIVTSDDISSGAGTLTEEEWRGFIKDFCKDRHSRFDYFTIPKLEDWPKKYNERSKEMMGLYEVAAINTKTNEFFCDKFIAKTSGSAERKLIKEYPEIDKWDEDYLLIYHQIIHEWESRKPKEVKIVKE